MSWFSTLFSGGDTVKAVGDTLDKLFTSDDEREEKRNERLKAELDFDYKNNQLIAQQNIAQTEVNKVEAASSNWFVSGWRPSIGWVGSIALAYKFILYPTLCWAIAFYPEIHLPPSPNADELYPIIMGMLGIGAMRSFDKMKGTDTK